MNVSREIKKAEAIKRMKAMHIYADAIKQFKDEDVVMVSEPPLGGLFWVNDDEKKMIHEFEQEHDVLVYLVVRTYTTFGKMDSLLYVSNYKDEWQMEMDDIADGYVMTYTINHDMPDCSEFGSIAYKSVGGGILRKF